ncbi:MAG: hypothetical protein DME97_05465 [Verrucomicrobia bacterium]|nr:MAG: hypothetical protein DME97_05465 [Verrucomicrobiota bacterium]
MALADESKMLTKMLIDRRLSSKLQFSRFLSKATALEPRLAREARPGRSRLQLGLGTLWWALL